MLNWSQWTACLSSCDCTGGSGQNVVQRKLSWHTCKQVSICFFFQLLNSGVSVMIRVTESFYILTKASHSALQLCAIDVAQSTRPYSSYQYVIFSLFKTSHHNVGPLSWSFWKAEHSIGILTNSYILGIIQVGFTQQPFPKCPLGTDTRKSKVMVISDKDKLNTVM